MRLLVLFFSLLVSLATASKKPNFLSYIGGGGPGSVMRKGDWKVIEQFERQTFEVYNLAIDSGETTNLVDQEKAKADELISDLRSWQEAKNAPRPTTSNSNYDPAAQPVKGRGNRGKKG